MIRYVDFPQLFFSIGIIMFCSSIKYIVFSKFIFAPLAKPHLADSMTESYLLGCLKIIFTLNDASIERI